MGLLNMLRSKMQRRNACKTKSGVTLYGISEYLEVVVTKYSNVVQDDFDGLQFVFEPKYNVTGSSVDQAICETISSMFDVVEEKHNAMIDKLTNANFNTSDETYIKSGLAFGKACEVFDQYCYEHDIDPNVFIDVIKDDIPIQRYYIDVANRKLVTEVKY